MLEESIMIHVSYILLELCTIALCICIFARYTNARHGKLKLIDIIGLEFFLLLIKVENFLKDVDELSVLVHELFSVCIYAIITTYKTLPVFRNDPG